MAVKRDRIRIVRHVIDRDGADIEIMDGKRLLSILVDFTQRGIVVNREQVSLDRMPNGDTVIRY